MRATACCSRRFRQILEVARPDGGQALGLGLGGGDHVGGVALRLAHPLLVAGQQGLGLGMQPLRLVETVLDVVAPRIELLGDGRDSGLASRAATMMKVIATQLSGR